MTTDNDNDKTGPVLLRLPFTGSCIDNETSVPSVRRPPISQVLGGSHSITSGVPNAEQK